LYKWIRVGLIINILDWQVTLRSDKVGLGMDEEKYAVLPSDTYQQATKKKAMARFESIQW